jgi:hypothetical protein
MKKFILVSGLLFLSFSLIGCTALIIGGGVAGGIAISKDTATVNLDRSFDAAWNVTYKQLEKMGAITLQDKKANKIEARIQDSDVTATIKQLTPKTITIEIKARKNFFPNVSLAQDILNEIIQKL